MKIILAILIFSGIILFHELGHFLLAKKNKIVPLEVKSSGYKTHKSLDVFTEKYSNHILKRYLVYTKDLSKEQDIFCIPVYMVPFL